MAPPVLQTARIFEDPEPYRSSKTHKRTTSVGDVLRGRRKENSPSKQLQPLCDSHASPSPLGERHINSPPQPKKVPLKGESESRPPMHKKSGSTTSIKSFLMGKEKSSDGQPVANKSEISPKKNRSSTNLAGLLKKRSKKDLRDNEPIYSLPSPSIFTESSPSPLWPQFSLQDGTSENSSSVHSTLADQIGSRTPRDNLERRISNQQQGQPVNQPDADFKPPQRPFLEHKSSRSSIFTENLDDENEIPLTDQTKSYDQPHTQIGPTSPQQSPPKRHMKSEAQPPERPEGKNRSSRIFDTIATLNMRPWKGESASPTRETTDREPTSPQDIDSAMENMLGRYDIPQNLRDQLRNLKPEVKAGLMKGARVGSGSSVEGEELRPSARRTDKERPSSKDSDEKDRKHSRSRSRTRNRILSLTKRNEASPTKQEPSNRSRSKSRPKSIDMSRPSSSVAMSSTGSLGSLNALKSPDSATMPGDFIHYLKEVQRPDLVEVGKIHKLRVLLRNESVMWTDAFVKKGGMDEIINLLYRIIKLEWREEHEDMLLHHCLACLKGLSTTLLAMQRLEALSGELFPALLKMLFDPERKGPSEYPTRGLIVSLIFSYVSATLHDSSDTNARRAREVLFYMRDPQPESDKQVLDFVSQMHTARPYRVWCKEVNNVTKEVFWIFLHHLNVIPIMDCVNQGETTFARAYFPAARAPHPAAPYVGGVEWEATQYIANHLDLLNALIVALPTQQERNIFREDLHQSGWEKVMGVSLRTCKEKFYTGVHDGLKAWIAAAKYDGWYVEDVRSGPPRDAASPKKSPVKMKVEEAPKITLDLHTPAVSRTDDAWL